MARSVICLSARSLSLSLDLQFFFAHFHSLLLTNTFTFPFNSNLLLQGKSVKNRRAANRKERKRYRKREKQEPVYQLSKKVSMINQDGLQHLMTPNRGRRMIGFVHIDGCKSPFPEIDRQCQWYDCRQVTSQRRRRATNESGRRRRIVNPPIYAMISLRCRNESSFQHAVQGNQWCICRLWKIKQTDPHLFINLVENKSILLASKIKNNSPSTWILFHSLLALH